MPTAEQSREALKIANEQRLSAGRERAELCGKPADAVAEAIVNPSKALASMQLGDLFGTRSRGRPGVVPRFGSRSLHRAFLQLINENPHGRQWWHDRLRLSELTESERRRLAEAVIAQAPKSWQEATS